MNNKTVGGPEGGTMAMRPCNSSDPAQAWALSPGVHPGDGATTNVKSAVGPKGGCWEITGCNTAAGAAIGTGYGCKALPKDGCSDLCVCNGAWALNANGSITSVMDGKCLETIGTRPTVGDCDPTAASQKWTVAPSAAVAGAVTFAQAKLCVASTVAPTPPTPPGPVPGPGGPANVTVNLADLNLGFTGPVRVRDVWCVAPAHHAHHTLPLLPAMLPPVCSFVRDST